MLETQKNFLCYFSCLDIYYQLELIVWQYVSRIIFFQRAQVEFPGKQSGTLRFVCRSFIGVNLSSTT